MNTWELIEKFEFYHDNEPPHPFSDLNFSVIEEQIKDYKEKYPQYVDLKFELNWKSFGYGAINYWYELIGKK